MAGITTVHHDHLHGCRGQGEVFKCDTSGARSTPGSISAMFKRRAGGFFVASLATHRHSFM